MLTEMLKIEDPALVTLFVPAPGQPVPRDPAVRAPGV